MFDALQDVKPLFVLIYAAFVGACLGSFVNVIVHRLPQGRSIIRPPSGCDHCGRLLQWYENIPIISYLMCVGKSRCCKKPLTFRHIITEVMMAVLMMGVVSHFGLSWRSVLWSSVITAVATLALIDLDHFWLPDSITLPLLLVAVLLPWIPGWITPYQALLGLIPGLLMFAVGFVYQKITGREGLGLGDVKLLAGLGALVGLPSALSILFLAAVQGAVIGSVMLFIGRRTSSPPTVFEDGWVPPARAIPFGPFLVLAFLEVLLMPKIFDGAPWRVVQVLLDAYRL